jgi:Lamin Tail Domain/FG-GAP-like repeat/Bacterial Ig-like domain
MITRAIRLMATMWVGLVCFIPTVSGQVFISQYHEGTSNNKWIELYNAGTNTVDLGAGGYRLGLWVNAARENWKTGAAPNSATNLIGTVEPGATFVLRNGSATIPTYGVADQTDNSVINFTGDDSLVLYLGPTFSTTGIVDSIGLVANSLANTSIVRKASISTGNTGTTDFDASQWDGFTLTAVDTAAPGTLERIGYHAHAAAGAILYVALDNPSPAAPYDSWATAATNIQDAIDAAASGDTILVSNGVYETGSRIAPGFVHANRVFIDKPITVQSVNGAAVTTIRGAKDPLTTNGNAAVRCVWMTNGATLVGFTLTNGATMFDPQNCGGENDSPCFAQEDTRGGGVLAGTTATIRACSVNGNAAHVSGGGAYGGNYDNCTISGNVAANGLGGGVASATVSNTMISGNFAASGGGGAWACTLDRSILHGNMTGNGGGGGALESTLNQCEVRGNTAGSYGGGAHLSTLFNCTLVANSAGELAGGGGAAYSSLTNCIVYYNTTASLGPNHYQCTIEFSCTTPDPGGTGNITNDPLFVSLATTNLALAAGSPCINRGNNASAPSGSDIAGNPRIVFGTVDMGAYEYQTPPASGLIHYVVASNASPVFPYTNWSTAAATIQDAIDTAVPGNTVLVSNGVYETGGRAYSGSLLTNRVIIDKPISVRSLNGPAVTIIRGAKDPVTTNGDAAVRCVWMTNGASLVGFTLTNGATRTSGATVNISGGGLIAVSSLASVSNCVISGNSAAVNGGGVQAGTLNNCLLTGNSAGSSGGGARSATLNNCTVTGNAAGNEGGGGSFATFNNSIVYFNTAAISNNYSGVTNSYTCTSPLPAGTGNIGADPLFVNAGAGNYRLLTGSPCRDTGDNALAPGSTDLDGKLRIASGTVDMGAYELNLFSVTNTVPSMNALDVSPSLIITAQFSADPAPASVTPTTFKAWGKQSGFYTGAYAVASTTASLDPSQNFKPGEEVLVMLSSGITNTQSVLDSYQFQFHAAAAGCPQFLFTTNGSLGTKLSRDVALGDLDRDGDLDAFVANTAGGSDIYTNSGNGTFTWSIELGINSEEVALGDLDSDGDLDAFVACYFGSNYWFRNNMGDTNGQPAFTSNSIPSLGSTAGVALGDLDGDGDLDAFTANYDGLPELVYLNDGSGNFTIGSTLGGKNSLGVALGDLDGDGDLDAIVSTDSSVNGFYSDIYLNNGNGTFASGGTVSENVRGSPDVALGDLDGDGDLDAILANTSTAAEEVCLNNGDATFSVSEFGGGWSTDVALGDLDGDGDLDAFIINENDEPDDVYLNNGSGAFTYKMGLGSKLSFGGIGLGDFDGDRDMDAFVANFGAGNDLYLNVSCNETGDVDADGLPTGFELGNGLDPFNPADAASDNDTDTQTALEEYIAGTSPTNDASFFNADGVGASLVRFDGVSGRVYSVEYRNNLIAGPSWLVASNDIVGSNGLMSVYVPAYTNISSPNATQSHLRVRVRFP